MAKHHRVNILTRIVNLIMTVKGDTLLFTDAFMPACKFYDDSINYYDHARLGGLNSHLKKTYKGKCNRYSFVLTG